MRISAKGRYALASTIYLAQKFDTGEYTTVLSISERLGISKIYLEQVFSLLKRGGIVNSVKGSLGGYQLARSPKELTLLDVLSSVEQALFEESDPTVAEMAPEIEKTLEQSVFGRLDGVLRSAMREITLEHLVQETERNKTDDGLMFYI